MNALGWIAAAGLTALLGVTAPGPSPPPPQPPPQLDDAEVRRAVDQLDGVVEAAMRRTGAPGVAVAVVHDGKVVHLKGYGVRKAGEQAAVDADTVFQLASVSKPIASTVVSGAVGVEGWSEPVAPNVPDFRLKDPWVTSHVTVADLFSHRSGLPDHAGDLLEDLGHDRAYILSHLRYEPLTPFRASYAYTNFGLTAAAQAVADEKGVPWEKLAADTLYKPAWHELHQLPLRGLRQGRQPGPRPRQDRRRHLAPGVPEGPGRAVPRRRRQLHRPRHGDLAAAPARRRQARRQADHRRRGPAAHPLARVGRAPAQCPGRPGPASTAWPGT
ncbi:hypothetical protein SGLAM104S_09032 [Streptomyces glaucescens]